MDRDRQAAIVAAVRALAAGEVASYGEIARRAGLPRGARQVVRALKGDDPSLPWHRVVRADGRIGFPEGSEGFREQVARLRADGVEIVRGRVKLRERAPDLDELLWR